MAVKDVSSAGVMARQPKVSILTITYKHEPFIAQCIEGAMSQETRFAFEMVIGEDHSPDRTREICLDYQRRYPEKIRLQLPERNIGRHSNFRHAYDACRGQYIAMLEGDDYWTRPDKLQTQADLLDAHPEWAICFHNARLEGENSGGQACFYEQAPKPVSTLEDFVPRNFIPTCSCMFRRGLIPELPEWYFDPEQTPYTDWILHVLNAAHGDVGYVHEVMAVHRRHGGGVWGSTFNGTPEGDIRRLKDRITTYARLRRCMAPRFAPRIRRQMAEECFHLGLAYREADRFARAGAYLLRALLTAPRAEARALRPLLATLAGRRRKGTP